MKPITAEDLRIELAKNPKVKMVEVVRHLKYSESSKTYLSKIFNGSYGASEDQLKKIMKAIKDIRQSKK